MREKERRIFFAGANLRSSSQDTGGEKILEGHAAVFNQSTNIGGEFIEVIERGAFDDCDMSDVALFVNHDALQIPLARTTSGTLSVTIDDDSFPLGCTVNVRRSPKILKADSTARRSFKEWLNLESTLPTRIIKKIAKVFEVSIANYPAYITTDVQARAKQMLTHAQKYSEGSMEELLRRMINRRATLINQLTASNDLAEVKALNQQLMTLAEDIAALRSAQKPDDEIDERTKAVNAYLAKKEAESRGTNPPKYIPGKGFIPAEEGRVDFMKATQLVQAGEDLKERRAVESAFNIFGERRTLTVQPNGNESSSIVWYRRSWTPCHI